MKTLLMSLSVALMCLALSWTQFESKTKLLDSNRLRAVGGVEIYTQQRIMWLKRCLAFAEAIEDPDIRFQEIDSLNRQLDEIDQELTVELGPELQIERIDESRANHRNADALPENDSSVDRRSAYWSFRKAKRKSHLRGGLKPHAARFSGFPEPIEPFS